MDQLVLEMEKELQQRFPNKGIKATRIKENDWEITYKRGREHSNYINCYAVWYINSAAYITQEMRDAALEIGVEIGATIQ